MSSQRTPVSTNLREPIVHWGWVLITREAHRAVLPGALPGNATKRGVKELPTWRQVSCGRRTGPGLLFCLFACSLAQLLGQPPLHYDVTEEALVANYQIQARLDPQTRTITASQTLHWTNRSRLAHDYLLFHLYLNAFKHEQTTFAREGGNKLGWPLLGSVPDSYWGWIEVHSIRGVEDPDPSLGPPAVRSWYPVQPDDDNAQDESVLRVDLNHPVQPGETLALDIQFTARLPRGISRTGWTRDYFFVAQWFPKIGVPEDDGWNCHQYHRNTEFFADFGRYDVTIQVPANFVVGATGALLDKQTDDGWSQWHFKQDYVHDFAWTASPRFLQFEETFQHPTLPPVAVTLLLLPEHLQSRARYLESAMQALGRYGEWFGPYPYSTLTVVDPAFNSNTGGMEYPTLVTGGVYFVAPPNVHAPEAVTVHEVGHQWWYGMVASNEFEEAWLDEGINSWAESRLMRRDYPPPAYMRRYLGLPFVFPGVKNPVDTVRLFDLRRWGHLDAMLTTSWQTRNRDSYRVNAYSKPQLVLGTLERLMGEDRLVGAMRAFFRRFAFRHPTTQDLIQTIQEETGEDWEWFFDETFRSDSLVDYGVVSIRNHSPENADSQGVLRSASSSDLHSSELLVERVGGARLPVEIQIIFEDGEVVTEQWDGKSRWKRLSYQQTSPIQFASLDPDGKILLDINPANNSLWAKPARGLSLATRKWSALWLFWIQNLLETLSLFG